MSRKKIYHFSADHVCPEWRFHNEPIAVYSDGAPEMDSLFYADHFKLGCGHNAKSPEMAIHEMVRSHGCENIRIVSA